MKYAISDKAADAYLTTMEFDTEVPDNYTRYALGYNEYITKARLLDTKEEAIRDYTKCNEALGEWKKKYRAIQEERNKALERAEKFKGIANSVYGMTIPSRCNGKQMFCDIATGKKILIDKKKYDELVEWIDSINMTYDTQFFMNKPAYLPIMIEHINDLTK